MSAADSGASRRNASGTVFRDPLMWPSPAPAHPFPTQGWRRLEGDWVA